MNDTGHNTGNASVRCVLIVVVPGCQSPVRDCHLSNTHDVKEYVVWSGGVLLIPDSPGVRF